MYKEQHRTDGKRSWVTPQGVVSVYDPAVCSKGHFERETGINMTAESREPTKITVQDIRDIVSLCCHDIIWHREHCVLIIWDEDAKRMDKIINDKLKEVKAREKIS